MASAVDDALEALSEMRITRRPALPLERNESRIEMIPEEEDEQEKTLFSSENKTPTFVDFVEYVGKHGLAHPSKTSGEFGSVKGPGDASQYIDLKLLSGPAAPTQSIVSVLGLGTTSFMTQHQTPARYPESPVPVRLECGDKSSVLEAVLPTFSLDAKNIFRYFSAWKYRVSDGQLSLSDLMENEVTIESANQLFWNSTGGKLTIEPAVAVKLEGTDDYYVASARAPKAQFSSIVLFCVDGSQNVTMVYHIVGTIVDDELAAESFGVLDPVEGFADDIKATLKRAFNIDGLLAARNKSFRTTVLSMPLDVISFLESPTSEILTDPAFKAGTQEFIRAINAVVEKKSLATELELVRMPAAITADYIDKSSALNGTGSKRNHPTIVRYLPRAAKSGTKGVRVYEIPVDSHATMAFAKLYPKLAKSGSGDDFEDKAAEIFLALEFEKDDHAKLFSSVPSIIRMQLDTSHADVVRAIASDSRQVFAGLQTIRQGDQTGAKNSFVLIVEKLPVGGVLGKLGSIYIVLPEI